MSQITFFGSGSGAGVLTLSGNTGGAVSPDGSGNISLTGSNGIVISPSGGGLSVANTGTGAVPYTMITSANSPYTVLSTNSFISANSTAGIITIVLPVGVPVGTFYTVKDRLGSASINNITVSVSGGALIDGALSFVLSTNHQSEQFLFDGTNYEVF